VASPAILDDGEATRRQGPRWRRKPSTPFLLRLAMALAVLPVAFFAAAVQLGAARNDSTLETVGRDATRGITVAQAIKLNIAELDEIVVQRLLEPAELGASGFPADYDDKREELHDNLVAAAAESSSGAAYRQPLINIEYALAHYHTLVRDAFAADADGDSAQAAALYAQAHDVVDGTLLTEAEFVDKANTYVLNDAYDTQTARSASTVRLIVASIVVLVVFLVALQLAMARRFRRVLNAALVAATLVAILTGAFALTRLDSSANELTSAREQAFDSVHVLARARATVVAARQAQGQLLLDPGDAPENLAGFRSQAGRVFRVQGDGDVAALASQGDVPEGAGGFLARVAEAGTAGTADTADADRSDAAQRSLEAFGAYLTADAQMRAQVAEGDVAAATAGYLQAQAFTSLTDAIDEAQQVDQAAFDDHVAAATDAAAHVGPVSLAAAGAVLALVIGGLYLRLREYRT
jgi:hypothetical protein